VREADQALDKKRYLIAGATFLASLGAGYAVQNSGAIASQFVGDAPTARVTATIELASANLPKVISSDSTKGFRIPSPPAESLTPVPRLPDAEGLSERVRRGETLPVAAVPATTHSAFGLPCDVELTSHNAGAAMVQLSLSAACHLNEPVEIRQGDLVFTMNTSNTGAVEVSVPAMSRDAVYTAIFQDGKTATTEITVDDLVEYDRVALLWEGESGLHLHALEYGAQHGENGHVWSGAPRSADYAARARGGFLARLGDPHIENAKFAEVYSFPSGSTAREGAVRLSVEAEVTAYTCDQDITAKSLQIRRGESYPALDITLSIPECSGLGDFLVLKNLLPDLSIAQN
jgi:hypothetical protein